jgi:hypothetical protein
MMGRTTDRSNRHELHGSPGQAAPRPTPLFPSLTVYTSLLYIPQSVAPLGGSVHLDLLCGYCFYGGQGFQLR